MARRSHWEHFFGAFNASYETVGQVGQDWQMARIDRDEYETDRDYYNAMSDVYTRWGNAEDGLRVRQTSENLQSSIFENDLNRDTRGLQVQALQRRATGGGSGSGAAAGEVEGIPELTTGQNRYLDREAALLEADREAAIRAAIAGALTGDPPAARTASPRQRMPADAPLRGATSVPPPTTVADTGVSGFTPPAAAFPVGAAPSTGGGLLPTGQRVRAERNRAPAVQTSSSTPGGGEGLAFDPSVYRASQPPGPAPFQSGPGRDMAMAQERGLGYRPPAPPQERPTVPSADVNPTGFDPYGALRDAVVRGREINDRLDASRGEDPANFTAPFTGQLDRVRGIVENLQGIGEFEMANEIMGNAESGAIDDVSLWYAAETATTLRENLQAAYSTGGPEALVEFWDVQNGLDARARWVEGEDGRIVLEEYSLGPDGEETGVWTVADGADYEEVYANMVRRFMNPAESLAVSTAFNQNAVARANRVVQERVAEGVPAEAAAVEWLRENYASPGAGEVARQALGIEPDIWADMTTGWQAEDEAAIEAAATSGGTDEPAPGGRTGLDPLRSNATEPFVPTPDAPSAPPTPTPSQGRSTPNERSNYLAGQIAALDATIQRINRELEDPPSNPRVAAALRRDLARSVEAREAFLEELRGRSSGPHTYGLSGGPQ